MKYHVIALDLDGTLLDRQKHILPQSLRALTHACQQGITVVIVTGRHHVAIHPFYQALQLTTPAICCNGTYTYHYQLGQVITGTPLTKSQALHITALLRHYPIQSVMYMDDAMTFQYNDARIARWQAWSEKLPEHQRPNLIQVEDYVLAIEHAEHIWKFATTSDDLDLLTHFSARASHEVGLACERSLHNQIDLAQSGNSKGNRLREWVESQGMSMEKVIAFGDNLNDVSMLTQAGLGVAMGNSCDEVKHCADIVIGDHDTPSIAQAIYEYVL